MKSKTSRSFAVWLWLAAFGCSEPKMAAPQASEDRAQAPAATQADPPAPAPESEPELPAEPPPAEGADAQTEVTGTPPDAGQESAPKPPAERPRASSKAAAPRSAPEKAPSPSQPAEKPKASSRRFRVDSGTAKFLIDAPLEKIKGTWGPLEGELTIDPSQLEKTRGELTVPLKTLKTHTFGSPSQNATQTKHALNWMQVDERADYARARFRIDAVIAATPSSVTTSAPVRVKLRGRLRLHGVEVPKTIEATVQFSGDPERPAELRVKTTAPMRVSLKQHDIKPRDLAGRFLAGAMDQIGQKIADVALVDIDFRAALKGDQG